MQSEPAGASRTEVGTSLLDRLIRTSDAILRARTESRRRHLQLTEIQHRVLIEVAQHEPVSPSELARLVHRDNAQVSRILNYLDHGNFLTRTRRPGRPSVAIRLTPTGRATLLQVTEVTRQWEEVILAELSPGEIATANDAISRLYDVALEKFGRKYACNVDLPTSADRAKAAS